MAAQTPIGPIHPQIVSPRKYSTGSAVSPRKTSAGSPGEVSPRNWAEVFSASEIFNSILRQDRSYSRIIATASQFAAAHDTARQCKGLGLFKLLAESGQAFEKGEEAACGLVASVEPTVREAAAAVLAALIEKGQACEMGLHAAQQLFQYPAKSDAVKLYAALINKKLAYPEASLAASALSGSHEEKEQALGLSLFDLLVKEGQSLDKAADAAFSLFQSAGSHDPVKSASRELIKALCRSAHSVTEAQGAASFLLCSDSNELRGRGRDLYLDLLDLDHFTEQAVEDANYLIKLKGKEAQSIGLQLFSHFVRVGYGHQEAENAAALALKSSDHDLQRKALKLYSELVQACQAFEPAAEAARTFVESADETLHYEAGQLFSHLVDQGQAYDLALEAAKNLAQSTLVNKQCQSLLIFRSLAKQGQAVAEAAERGLTFAGMGQNKAVHLKTLELFQVLAEHGQELEKAEKAAEQLISSSVVMVQRAAGRLKTTLRQQKEKDHGS